MRNNRSLLLAALIFALVFQVAVPARAQGTKLKVIATITIIRDIAQNVAGDRADVGFLVPSNGDVHEFEPKPDDVRKIADADLIFVNGVGLEQFLDKLIAESGTKGMVVTVSRGIAIQKFQSTGAPSPSAGGDNAQSGGIIGISGNYQCGAPVAGQDIGECDPHMWQNVTNVIVYALNIRDALSAADPANADTYSANAGLYINKLQKLDAAIFAGLSRIPAANRVIVTNHDSLGYFAARYGFRIAGVILPGGTTGQEPAPKEIAALIETIKTEGVKAIFLENVSSEKLAGQIADGAGVNVVQTLYTDALGDAGTPGDTYIGMMTANLNTLQDTLR